MQIYEILNELSFRTISFTKVSGYELTTRSMYSIYTFLMKSTNGYILYTIKQNFIMMISFGLGDMN